MSQQAEIQTPEPPKNAPFQFGLKHLLALPVGVALFFSFASLVGTISALLVPLFVLTTVGLCYRSTRYPGHDSVCGSSYRRVALLGLCTAPNS